MITVRVSSSRLRYSGGTAASKNRLSMTAPCRYSAPKFSACFFMFSTRSGPLMPSGKPGKFSTRVVSESCPPASWPPHHERLQIGPRRINGGSISGAAGADNDDVSHEFKIGTSTPC